ncbi:MAG: thiamine phosphate synthase [bacterium]|jgi:thiamine-phosphate diphosphorylase|nr:MAG: thiamine phosphate synthase [bacterium]
MLARLHLVTDDAVLRAADFRERAQAVLAAHGSALALHLRGHGVSGAELFELARDLAFGADGAGAELLVNDRVDVALAAGADGVQLGRRSLPIAAARALLGADAWIGYSAHGAEEAAQAAADGADFILVGTLYRTASHPEREPAGVERVRETVAALAPAEVPVIGIGGITPERVREVLAAGAYGVAVLGGVWHAADPVAAAADYIAALGVSG